MFNTGIGKQYSSSQNFQINLSKKDSEKSTQNTFTTNIFENNISEYAIKIADKGQSAGFPASRDPLGGLNFSGDPQLDLAPSKIESDKGIKIATCPEGGLNLTGDPSLLPPVMKAKDKGTALSVFPDGGLNLTGQPIKKLILPVASGKVDFPEESQLLSAGKQVDFPGNSDMAEEISTGSLLPNKKYIVTFPEDEISSTQTSTIKMPPSTPQQPVGTKMASLVAPQSIAPKALSPAVAPSTNASIAKTTVKEQTYTPKATAPMTAVPEAAPIQKSRPIPNASAEIKSLYGQKMNVKNQRLYKLINENEYNPQLREYLLTCRVDDLVKKVSAINPEYITHLGKCCEKYKITKTEDKLMLLAQLQQESNINPEAVSRSGAFGFMQIMPGTAALMNKAYYKSSDPLVSWDRQMDYKNPLDNIEMGVALMAENLRRYKKAEMPILTALGAYNAGTVPTDAYLNGTPMKTKKGTINAEGSKTLYGIPPYDEPQLYYQIIPATQDYMLRHPEKIASIIPLLTNPEG